MAKKKSGIVVPRFCPENGFTTSKERSVLMSKIKSKDSKPELLLRHALWKRGIRYRKNYSGLPGKPDIYISKGRLAVFIDGEFWHGFDWDFKKSRIKSNNAFWTAKIERNMERDKINNRELNEMGINVLRFWGNMVLTNLDDCVEETLNHLSRKQ